jgi:hypothetical protein
MELYAALDVALEKTALCIVDRDGAVVLEANVASDPDAFANRLAPFRVDLVRLGLEAGPLASEQRPQSLAREEKKRPWAIGFPGFNSLPRGHFTMSFLAS